MKKILLCIMLLSFSSVFATDITPYIEGFARMETSSMDRFYGDKNLDEEARPFSTHSSNEYGFDNRDGDTRYAIMSFSTADLSADFRGIQFHLNVVSGGGKTYIYQHSTMAWDASNAASTRPSWNNLFPENDQSANVLLDSITLESGTNSLISNTISEHLKACIAANKDLNLVFVSALDGKDGRTVLEWGSSATPCKISTIDDPSALMNYNGEDAIFYGETVSFKLGFMGTAPFSATIGYMGTDTTFSNIMSADTTIVLSPKIKTTYALESATDNNGTMTIINNGLSIIDVIPLSTENKIITTLVGSINESSKTVEDLPLGITNDMLTELIYVSEYATFKILNADSTQITLPQQALDNKHIIMVTAQNGDIQAYSLAFSTNTINSNDTLSSQITTIASLAIGNYVLQGDAELHITSAEKPIILGTVDLQSEDAWLFFDQIKPSVLVNNYLSNIKAYGATAVLDENVRVVQYVQGCVVIPHGKDYQPVEVFDEQNLSGKSLKLEPYKIYKIADLGDMNDAIRSFKIKRGYYVTMAQQESGMGYSRVFVAHEQDLVFNTMPEALDTSVSFLRVIPWRWPNKKGYPHGHADSFHSGWRYNWSAGSTSTLDIEYVPIQQHLHWPGTSGFYKEDLTHLLGMNEPDRPDQANCTVDQALAVWPKLMATGLRLGSPAPSDGGLNWLINFIDECDKRNYRVDFVAMHWYLGCQSAQSFYDRVKWVHERTGRPIWITEWNNGADWTSGCKPSSQENNAKKIQAFLNMLDDAPFVERYCIFDWLSGGSYSNWSLWEKRYNDDTFTPTGLVYRNQPSPMSYNPNKEFVGPYVELMPPTDIKATLNNEIATLTWNDLSENENGVKIERSDNGNAYQQIAYLQEADLTSFTDSLKTFGHYKYRIRQVIVGKSNSDYSDIAEVSYMRKGDKIISWTKPATASSERGSYTASKVTDIIKTDASRWVTAEDATMPQWVEIDLQSNYDISYIKFYTGYDGFNKPINDFKFQYWDGQQWVDALNIVGNTDAQYEGGFDPVITNKVRLYIAKSTEDVVRLFELEVFGKQSAGIKRVKNLRQLSIQPNPAENAFYFSGLGQEEDIYIFDISGKMVLRTVSNNKVDISSLKEGLYIVRLNNTAPIQLIIR